jgi:hypothetical protein
MTAQTIDVSLKVGSRVSILENVDTDEGGFIASTVFEDVVEQYIPESNKLSFEESDIGYAEFVDLLEEYDSVQIIKE